MNFEEQRDLRIGASGGNEVVASPFRRNYRMFTATIDRLQETRPRGRKAIAAYHNTAKLQSKFDQFLLFSSTVNNSITWQLETNFIDLIFL